jgi:hypothetical protein
VIFDLRIQGDLRHPSHCRRPENDYGRQTHAEQRNIKILASPKSSDVLGFISSSPSTIFLKDRGESTSISERDVSKELKSREGPGFRSSKRGRSSNLTETSGDVLRC